MWSVDEGWVHLRVVSALEGNLLEQGQVSVRLVDGTEFVRRSLERDFRLAPGLYEISAFARPDGPGTIRVAVGGDELWATIGVSLDTAVRCWPGPGSDRWPSRNLEVNILDGGKAAEGIWIKVVLVPGNEMREGVTGKDGRVLFETVPRSRYWVLRDGPGLWAEVVSHWAPCLSEVEVDFAVKE